MSFPLGRIVTTPGVAEKILIYDQIGALHRFRNRDWGEMDVEDIRSNDQALRDGERLLGSYTGSNGEKFWIITEWDRSVTTLLLPDEY